jgi:hypothetical protein
VRSGFIDASHYDAFSFQLSSLFLARFVFHQVRVLSSGWFLHLRPKSELRILHVIPFPLFHIPEEHSLSLFMPRHTHHSVVFRLHSHPSCSDFIHIRRVLVFVLLSYYDFIHIRRVPKIPNFASIAGIPFSIY